jgi:hypothetical protein
MLYVSGFQYNNFNAIWKMIKTAIVVNLAMIDRVIIVCAGRISSKDVVAVNEIMDWLSFETNKQRFLFIYNKSN